MDDTMLGVLIGGGTAIISGLIGFLSSVWSTRLNNASAEKRHVQTTVVKAAIENWKEAGEFSEKHPKAGTTYAMYPLEHYIIHMLLTVDMIDQKLTKCNVTQRLQNIHEIVDAAGDEIARYDQQRRNKGPRPH